ncbi:hypothetical protein NPIL_407761 [Nephila pilipes]|uniref:Uncharacterized protein n=1 Tax=Nephila pilipes TaxID=299642 RepID=A0A8X6TXZ7_NEPPI|nr:hypothetical protein NPIL_407761 [Nephila pilipes]
MITERTLHRFLTAILVFLFCLNAIVQAQKRHEDDIEYYSSNVNIGTYNRSEWDNATDIRYNKSGSPFNGSMKLRFNLVKVNYSLKLNFLFNGTVGNPKGDEVNLVMDSPEIGHLIKFKAQLIVFNKTLINDSDISGNKNTTHNFYNEWNAYRNIQPKRNSSEEGSHGNQTTGIICFRLVPKMTP